MSAVTLGPQWDEVVAIRTTEGSEANDPASKWLGVHVLDGQYVAQFDFVNFSDVRGFIPFRLGSKSPWEFKTTLNQVAKLMARYIGQGKEAAVRCRSENGGVAIPTGTQPWSRLMREALEEWWESHLTSDAVRMAAMVFCQNCPVALEVNPKKVDLIAALLDQQVPPCPPYVLGVLFAEMKGKRAREKPPAIVAGPPVQGPERVAYTVTPPGSPDRDQSQPQEMMSRLADFFRDFSSQAQASPAKETKAVDQFAAWEKKVYALVNDLAYVDPAILSPANLRRKREKLHGRLQTNSKAISLSNGNLVVGGADDGLDAHEGCSPREFHAGFDKLLAILSESQKGILRVQDMLAWKNEVVTYEGFTPEGQVLYMREFMYKYQGVQHAQNWKEKFASDFPLLMAITKKDSGKLREAAPGTDRQHGRDWKRGDGRERTSERGQSFQRRDSGNDRKYATRGRSPPRRSVSPRRPPRRSSVSPHRTKSPPVRKGVCKSRIFPNHSCKFSKCKFSHVCPLMLQYGSPRCREWMHGVGRGQGQEGGFRFQFEAVGYGGGGVGM